ncbi:MAG: acylphosphatase [Desulfuromonadaceae bacterium]|nr:acylphosphatase [Desulfuromonas sp.]MDY0184494.1 acylphosphatase [Desulfuromonadaceae bacterium]
MEYMRARIKVEGLVQGVGYRAYAAEIAARLGLNGWVRNLLDGSVEALLEGDEKMVQQAITACRIGPPRAKVEHISIDISRNDIPGTTPEFERFTIRY